MAKTSQEIEQEFITGLKPTTGRSLQEWMNEIKHSTNQKRNDIVKWLKDDHGFGHMHASLLMGIYANKGKPVYASEQVLLDNQFIKNENMRPLYARLIDEIKNRIPAVNIVVKKTYVSLTEKREFAAVNIKKGALRVGMDLGEMPFSEWVEKAKLTGPMPRISHMVVVKTEADINDKLFDLMNKANKNVNG